MIYKSIFQDKSDDTDIPSRLSICRSPATRALRNRGTPGPHSAILQPSNLTTLPSYLRRKAQYPSTQHGINKYLCQGARITPPLSRRAYHTHHRHPQAFIVSTTKTKGTQTNNQSTQIDHPHPSRNCTINLRPRLMRDNPLLPPLPPALLAIPPATQYIRAHTIPTRPHSR